jgi:hypothetical protein
MTVHSKYLMQKDGDLTNIPVITLISMRDTRKLIEQAK